MREKTRYRFVYSPIFLGLFAIGMLASSLMLNGNISDKAHSGSITFLKGIFDSGYLNPEHSAAIVIILTIITSVILYFFNSRVFSCGRPFSTAPLIFFIFVLTPETSLVFTGTTIATPLVLYSLYISLFTKDNDRNLVLSVLLVSVATLFDPHLIPVVPLILYYSLRTSSFDLRNIVISVIMVVLPYVFIISLRHLFYDDNGDVINQVFTDLKAISAPGILVDSLAGLLLVFTFVLIFYRSAVMVGKVSGTYKIIKSASVSRNVVLMILLSLVTFFYPETQPAFFYIISLPLSLIVAEYITHGTTSAEKRAEFFVLLIMIALNRVTAFL